MEILPTAIRLGTWAAYLGLACGVLYSVGGLVADTLTTGLNWGTAMAFLALVGMPALAGSAGFLVGTLIALAARGVSAALKTLRR